MEAKQVWRAALGELQVSLSPANFETWLKDTQLVEIEDNRYRISAPNGFARDWLDNRYRPLISQTLARVVGGSVQVEFIVADASGPVPEQVDEEAQVTMPPLSAGGNAINQLRTLDGNPSAVLYADGAHFWPHGLNQASEATSADEYIRNVRMVAALRQDMGL